MERTDSLTVLERYSFSDEAGRTMQRAHPGMQLAYGADVDELWKALNAGSDILLPFENSSGDVVSSHFQRLCKERFVRIIGEVKLKVRMCAGMVQGADLQGATVACSHQKGLDQASDFIDALSGIAERRAFPSTVAAVRHVAASGDARCVVFASRTAIDELGLSLVADDVANLKGDENETQFLRLHANGEPPKPDPESPYHAAIITPENTPGVLQRILSMVDNARVDLTSIQSIGIGKKKYSFFMEMTRLGMPREFALMAEQLGYRAKVDWLGSWDERLEN